MLCSGCSTFLRIWSSSWYYDICIAWSDAIDGKCHSPRATIAIQNQGQGVYPIAAIRIQKGVPIALEIHIIHLNAAICCPMSKPNENKTL